MEIKKLMLKLGFKESSWVGFWDRKDTHLHVASAKDIFREGQKDILKIYLKQFEDKTKDRTCLWNCMADDLDELEEGRDINRDI